MKKYGRKKITANRAEKKIVKLLILKKTEEEKEREKCAHGLMDGIYVCCVRARVSNKLINNF